MFAHLGFFFYFSVDLLDLETVLLLVAVKPAEVGKHLLHSVVNWRENFVHMSAQLRLQVKL
jgi:hypothetical protein